MLSTRSNGGELSREHCSSSLLSHIRGSRPRVYGASLIPIHLFHSVFNTLYVFRVPGRWTRVFGGRPDSSS